MNMHRSGWLRVGIALFAAIATTSTAFAADDSRKLGTCGPPPRKNPERQNSGEGMPPLPLPVTPLRRSEPKAEPAPPILFAKLEYGTTQDWNTDPGDLDNLMRHARYQLGIWYGFRNLPIDELTAKVKAGEKVTIPIVYMTGHDDFTLTAEQRGALRQYVLDGGTLFGEACCGQPPFAAAFRREVLAMFPDRAFALLEPDNPLFHAYYPYVNIHEQVWKDDVKSENQIAPIMFGMTIGCRTAVLLSPIDLSCGWDEHTHTRGDRLIPGDAIRLGINLVSYVAAERPLGAAQAVTREIRAPLDRPRGHFAFAQLRHQGDWNPDPNSVYQMLRYVAQESSLAVAFDLQYADASAAQLAPYPFVYLTGHGDPKLSDAEVDALRNHLRAGGFLFVNNCCGRQAFDRAAHALIARLFPDQPLQAIKPDHPLLRAFTPVVEGRDRATSAVRPVELAGITVKNRLVLVYSKSDMVTALKQVFDPYGDGYDADTCHHLTLDVIAYAMQN